MVSGVPAEAASADAKTAAASSTTEAPAQDVVRPDSVSAMVTARATGQRVEDLSQRTEEAQVFANPDGTWTSESAPEPVRVQDAQGDWHGIDTTLVAKDGGFAPEYAASDLVLSGGGDRTFAQLTSSGHDLAWKWTGDLPAPVIKGDTATYRGVAPGDGDLVVTATATGFSYDVVLHQQPADPLVLATPVVTDGAQLEQTGPDGVAITTAAGKTIASAPHPMMWDAQKDDQGQPANVQPVATDVAATATGGRVTLSPDQGFLTDPSTQYPVVVDPSFITKTTGDMWIENIDNTSAMPGTEFLKVGSQDGGTHKFRTYLDFKDSTAASKWNNNHVTSATLRFWNYNSGSCAAGAVRASMITGDWATSNLTWGNQPTVDGSKYDDYSAAHGATNCDPDDADFDVTKIVNAWAQDPSSNHGIRVKAVDETSTNTYREYRSVNYTLHPDWQPKLMVTYNHYPSTPSAPSVTTSPASSVGYSRSLTPTLKATVTDQDSTVRGNFEILQNGSAIWSATSAPVDSGSSATVSVPSGVLSNGGTYSVRVKGNDGTDVSKAYSPTTTFKVDTTAPNVTVSASGFTNGQWATTAPSSNTFTLTGSSDTASFAYSEDGVSQGSKAAGSTGAATVSWLPKDGKHTLVVTPTDKAGNPGNKVTFSFGLGAPGFLKPTPAQSSTGVFPVALNGPPGATAATVQWRYAGQPADAPWNDAEGVTTTTGSPWDGTVSNTSDNSASPELLWDVSAQLDPAQSSPGGRIEAPALLDIRACFTYDTRVCGSPQQIQFVPSAFGGSFPTDSIGPATVALSTGEMTLSSADAADSAAGLSRTFTTYGSSTLMGDDGPFGPAWTADALTAATDATTATVLDNRDVDGTFVLTFPDNTTAAYGLLSDGDDTGVSVYAPVGVDDGSRLALDTGKNPNKLTLSEVTGASTVWTANGGDWLLNTASTASGDDATTNQGQSPPTNSVANTSGEPYWISELPEGSPTTDSTYLACKSGPASSSATDVSAWLPTIGNGCRGLLMKYNDSHHVTEVDRVAYEPHTGADGTPGVGAGMGTKTLTTYTYNADDTLASACDLRQGPAFCTKYTYVTKAGRILVATETPPGQATWTFHYDDQARLTSVTRPLPSDSAGNGPATWTLVYNVDPSGAGLPDLSATAIVAWGQDTAPSTATAVFGPDHVPAASGPGANEWPFAQLWYTSPDGTLRNTAQYGDGQWLVDTTWYDDNGNVTQRLSAAGREDALASSASQQAQVAANESWFTKWSGDGTRITDQYGPSVDDIQLDNGGSGPYRSHIHYLYDDQAPELAIGRPALPNGQTSFNLVVEEDYSSADPDLTNDHDTEIMRYRYDPVVSGDGDGWALGQPTRTEIQLKDGTWSTTTTRYDAQGNVIQTIKPGSATNSDGTGSGPRSTNTEYYSSDNSAIDAACQDHPEWAGLPCRSGPASQQDGAPVPTTETLGYSADLAATRVDQVSGGTTRTVITSYDEAGRAISNDVRVSGDSSGSAPALTPTTYNYDDQGNQTSQSAGSQSIHQTFDDWGRALTYTDANGNAAAYTYTADGMLSTFDDGIANYSYTYDSPTEHRRMITHVITGAASAPDGYDFKYDADGQPNEVTYPNGLIATRSYDQAGDVTGLAYTQSGQTILDFNASYDSAGRIMGTGSDLGTRNYKYDDLGRLTTVEESLDGQCSTRVYSFNASSDRTAESVFGPDSTDGSCQQGVASSRVGHTYDSTDRITDAGFSYDDLGRTTSLPAAATAPGAADALRVSYYANDMVASLDQAEVSPDGTTHTQSASYALDPAGRIDSIVRATDGTETSRLRYEFADESDSPASVAQSNDGGATWSSTRYLSLPALGMVATVGNGSVEFQLANIHGDVVATQADNTSAVGIDSCGEADEYGNVASANGEPRYGWLGSAQRSTDAIGGLVLMGARLYNPMTGTFLSPDPVPGGSATPYAYPTDPINFTDLNGQWWNPVHAIVGAIKSGVIEGLKWGVTKIATRVICGPELAMICPALIAAAVTFGVTLIKDVFLNHKGIGVSVVDAMQSAFGSFVSKLVGKGSIFGDVKLLRKGMAGIRRFANESADLLREHGHGKVAAAIINGCSSLISRIMTRYT